MNQTLWWRWTIIICVMVYAVLWTVPNFIDGEKVWWPTKNKMTLGLDIQGGSHLVLRADTDTALKTETQRYANEYVSQLKDQAKVEIKSATVIDPLRGAIDLQLKSGADQAAVAAFVEKQFGNEFRVSEKNDQVVKIEFTEYFMRNYKSRLVEQSILTIRNRIDEFGVSEPSISAQGADRILVQLPGIKDASQAKDLINKTAKLDFMIVSQQMKEEDLRALILKTEADAGLKLGELKYSNYITKLNAALKGKIPENTLVYFEKSQAADTLEAGWIPMLLETTQMISGDRLTDAHVGYAPNAYGASEPMVFFRMDGVGTREMAELTTKNRKRLMAIVLDRVVKSAPNINEPITGGSGQITLGSSRDIDKTMADAKIVATALRAGALPATLEQLEERTVGPSLGRDAIQKGQIATGAACLAVFLFMFLYYRSFGLIADIALAFNLLLTLAILSGLGATLTLPGVAGLALTVGISVDASVIIYERVKEEMSKGATLIAAIREGYDRAFSSIFDANLTSIAVCVVLMYFGTGPVRGFAITLLTGLVITMFTAVFVTRAILDLLVVKWKWNLAVKW
jgi:preprotein translocase subunit SecD